MSFLEVLEESELWLGELRQLRLKCGRLLPRLRADPVKWAGRIHLDVERACANDGAERGG